MCNECDVSWYLYNHNTCVNSTFCAYPNYVTQAMYCFSCEYPCKTCTSLAFNGCLSCQGNFSLYLGECLPVCPPGYYSSKNICYMCDVKCLQCSETKC
jgi:hypothetical protein